MAHLAPHLSPRLIAKPLEDLRSWHVPSAIDRAGLHRGVLRVLVATDALTRLELPAEIRAPRLDDAREMAYWDTTCALLDQAIAELCGPVHAARLLRLHELAPGHALQLERLRVTAVARLRQLRTRVDFACGGAGRFVAPRQPADAPRPAVLQ